LEWQSGPNGSRDPFAEDVVRPIQGGTMDLAGSFYYLIAQRAAILAPLMASHPEKYLNITNSYYLQLAIEPLLKESNNLCRFKIFFRQPHFSSVRNVFFEPFHKSFLIAYITLIPILFVITVNLLKLYNPISYNSFRSLREALWWIVTLHFMKSTTYITT
jgi:hypothetical protein